MDIHCYSTIYWKKKYSVATELLLNFGYKSTEDSQVGPFLDSILLYWSMCLILCKSHSISMTVDL